MADLSRYNVFCTLGLGGQIPLSSASSRVCFGVFEVDLKTRELRKRGIRIKIQDQPFQVLATLLERPGQIIGREELKAKIWPEDTFVDFDLGLNKAVNRIREALSDRASTPRFIETLPRRGYRFIGSITGSNRAAMPSSGVARPLRSSLLPPPNTSYFVNQFAISPDGTRFAFVAIDSNRQEMLWVRDLATAGAQQLNGTQGARAPFWRPDSRHVGFFADGKLKTIDIAGGAVRTVCDARVPNGGAWHTDDLIVFSGQVQGPLCRVPANGGTPVPVTPEPAEQSAQLHCWPAFLPGTDRFLYYVFRSSPADRLTSGIYAGSLTSKEARLVSTEINGNVAFAGGHLFFVKNGGLYRQPFDSRLLQFSGNPVPIAPHEMETWDVPFLHSGFSVSEAGILILQSRLDFALELVWADGSGQEQGRIQGGFCGPDISPDGRFVAVAFDEFHDGRWYICVHDIEREVTTRLTDGGQERIPSWSPDGQRIIYNSFEGHWSCTYEIAADASGPPRLLLEPFSVLAHCSGDGTIVFAKPGHGSPQLMACRPGTKEVIEIGPGAEPQFSPDGRWIAFAEWGGSGIGVLPFAGPGPRIRISKGRGAQPRWSHDGTQLFYIAPDKTLMAVTFNCETGRAGPPRELFQTRIARASVAAWQYDVSPDGRFLINSLPAASPPLTLLVGL